MCVCTRCFSAYTVCVIKRTSINLDLELVAEARGIFGTKNTTDMVHTALREVVRREKLKALSKMRFDHMPDGWWDELERGEHWPDDDDRRWSSPIRAHGRADIVIRSSTLTSRGWLRQEKSRLAMSCGSSSSSTQDHGQFVHYAGGLTPCRAPRSARVSGVGARRVRDLRPSRPPTSPASAVPRSTCRRGCRARGAPRAPLRPPFRADRGSDGPARARIAPLGSL